MEKRREPRLFNIPAGLPFLETLAEALLAQRLVAFPSGDPLALAGVTILLPTRRAARALRDVLSARLGAGAAILPAIRTIADMDEEEHLLGASAEPLAERIALPAAVSALERRLTLARLTLGFAVQFRHEWLSLRDNEMLSVPASAADAVRLAGDLARLLDDMETAGIRWERVGRLVPEDHARYFQMTLEFLKIVAEHWPQHLRELDRVDPVVRRDTLIRAFARRVSGPIVAAGSTGTIPATAELLKAIALLPDGAVVLPGLDQALDEAAWAAIGNDQASPGAQDHPQSGLKHLLTRLQVARDAVVALAEPPPDLAARSRVIGEATRPAETTDSWAEAPPVDSLEAALGSVSLVIARNEQEEAVAIALALREAVETEGTVAALVTPDRTIARRAAVELARWGLSVDDSAGVPLERTETGVFARLTLQAALSDGEPAALLAWLKHPLAAFGMERASCRRAARMLELALFRGNRVGGGSAALPAALAARKAELDAEDVHVPAYRRRLEESDWDAAQSIAARLAAVLAPLERALTADQLVSAAEATGLLAAAASQAATDGNGIDGLAGGADGAALLALFAGLTEPGGEGSTLMLHGSEYPFFLAALMAEIPVPQPPRGDPRIFIWGALEARLQSVDLMILAGLDEGTWPAGTRTDPFLSRAMRAEIGLPPPERRIGLSAHDFAQAMGAARVVVARAERRGGTPTVEARWLQRLRALAGEIATRSMVARGQRYAAMARALDHVPGRAKPVDRPRPCPPVAVRPRRLSITEIETLIRDPYAIYARHILRLRPLDELGVAPDARLRGTLMHDVLNRFTAEWRGAFDAGGEARLRAIAEEALRFIADFGDIHAVWTVRFAAIARWFVAWEAARDASVAARHTEVEGKLDVAAPGGLFVLSGRADRIDEMRDGSLAIYDFKTGTPQTERTVFAGLTPQMTLEAAMARSGGFAGVPKGNVSDLAWLALGKAGRDEPYQSAAKPGQKPDDLAEGARAMFAELVAAFDNEDWPYLSRARPMLERYLGDYEHLARVREWALVDSAEDVEMQGGGGGP